jgi:predicted O-methyltransferase YrrM
MAEPFSLNHARRRLGLTRLILLMPSSRALRIVEAIRRLLKPLVGPVVVFGAIPWLRRAARRASDLDDELDLAYGFGFAGIDIAPCQIRSEIRQLLEILEETRPRAALEIGTATGGSLFLLARVASEDATLVSVDLPHGEFGGGYPHWREPLYRSFAPKGGRIELIRADSHDPQTLGKVTSILHGRPLDFLFIDGDHTRDGVERDFDIYSPLVREAGLIAFHDIVPSAERMPADQSGLYYCSGEVPEFWRQVKEVYDSRELVADWAQGSFGIGVLTYHRGSKQ